MLRYIVFLAAAVTLQLSLAQTLSAQPHEGQVLLSASGGDDLGAADWTDEGAYGIHPMDADDRADAALDEMYADAEDDALYPFANAEHGWPFVEPLAGALGGDRQVLDPRFNNGKLYLDRFGGTASDKGNYLGQKVLRLSNGHVLTVALVPPLGAGAGTLIPAPSNIGMIRHNDKGVRQTWPHAAGAFTSLERYHFVFPNQRDSADGNFSEIHDVAEHNDWIYVLATRRVSSTDTDVRVVRFSLNSSRWRWNQVGSWAGTREEGVGFSFHHSDDEDRLTVVTYKEASATTHETWMTRLVVHSDHTVTHDASFGSNGVYDVTWNFGGIPRASAGSTNGTVFIGGDYLPQHNSAKRDGYVTSQSATGPRNGNWGANGVRTFGFDLVSGGIDEVRDIAIHTRTVPSVTNTLWVLVAAQDRCGTSAGVVKIGHRWGELDSDFGVAGQMHFGSTGSPPFCNVSSTIEPHAIVRNDERLAIVGYSRSFMSGSPIPVVGGPSFDIVDSRNGELMDRRIFKPTNVDLGAEGAGSAFHSVVVSENDGFFAVGAAKDTKHNQRMLAMTARVRADRIFGDGME